MWQQFRMLRAAAASKICQLSRQSLWREILYVLAIPAPTGRSRKSASRGKGGLLRSVICKRINAISRATSFPKAGYVIYGARHSRWFISRNGLIKE